MYDWNLLLFCKYIPTRNRQTKWLKRLILINIFEQYVWNKTVPFVRFEVQPAAWPRGYWFNARTVALPLSPRHNPNLALACYLLAHLHRPFPSPLYWFPIKPTLPPFLFLYSWMCFDWWLSLQPPAQAGSSLANFSTLKMEAIRSSETLVHTRSTRRHIPEDGILQNCTNFLSI
jgi:hypothetical protein